MVADAARMWLVLGGLMVNVLMGTSGAGGGGGPAGTRTVGGDGTVEVRRGVDGAARGDGGTAGLMPASFALASMLGLAVWMSMLARMVWMVGTDIEGRASRTRIER
jgi:hypothetical protein